MSFTRAGNTLLAIALFAAISAPISAAPNERTYIALLDLRLRTCDVDFAGTNSNIAARVKSDRTLLNYPRNDFLRGEEFTYALVRTNVETFADIQELTIENLDTNHLCIDKIQLLVDRAVIFERVGRIWLGPDSPAFTVSGAELRSHERWINHVSAAGWSYDDKELLKHIIAAGVATGMYAAKSGYYSWHTTDSIKVTGRDASSFNVHIDLEYLKLCTDYVNDTKYWCRSFLVSGDLVLGLTCPGDFFPRLYGFLQVKEAMAGLTSGMWRWWYQLFYAADVQSHMNLIAQTTADAFGRLRGCPTFTL
jgi:hypothetical protein